MLFKASMAICYSRVRGLLANSSKSQFLTQRPGSPSLITELIATDSKQIEVRGFKYHLEEVEFGKTSEGLSF